MKKSSSIIKISGFVLNLFNLLMFFAMRPCWSGISKTLGYSNGKNELLYYCPIYICVLLLVIFVLNLVSLIRGKNRKWVRIVFLVTGIVFLAGVLVIIKFGALDYMRFIWVYFIEALIAAAVIAEIAFLLFFYPKSKAASKKWFRVAVLILLIVAGVLGLTNFSTNKISQGPVVYAVEDEYQIVFSSKAESIAWVSVGNEKYYELYAGSMVSDEIHKICVPMEVLDNAKSYEITVQQMIYRGPFGGFKGHEISESYSFKPADFSDGIQYLSFSDIHMHKDAALKTESMAEDYDFLVMNGDFVSDVETFDDANYVNELAYEMTKGSIPVIYARGNHEVKGEYSDLLYKFVGSKNQSFYYTVRLGEMYAIVLDLGEDHDDDWWEYYGTAVFDQYHEEQIEFVENEIANGSYKDAKYKLAICHIPIVFVNNRHNHEDVKAKLTSLLNDMGVDMLLAGHQHETYIFEPGLVEAGTVLTWNAVYGGGTYKGYLTDFNFPSLMIGKPGFTQTDDDESSCVALYIDVDLEGLVQTAYYLNSNGEKLSVVNPFADKAYGTEITIDMENGKME